MIKLENTKVFNFEGAFRGLRNPLNSWDKSDSDFGIEFEGDFFDYNYQDFISEGMTEEEANYCYENSIINSDNEYVDYALLGPKDINLAQRMIAGGTDEGKFLRQILVCVDITAPLAW